MVMLTRVLQRFDPFRTLNWNELSTVARHTQVLNLPADRWLLREGRRLSGSYYLARGKLRVSAPVREVRYNSSAAQQPIYPGSAAIQTLTQVQIFRVDTRPIEFLLQGNRGDHGLEGDLEPWEQRFLNSPILQRLDPCVWQRLFSELQERQVRKGETLVRLGDPAEAFYVLKSGHASVHRMGRTLAYLGPGDFFGEDALIMRSSRNATVTALEPGWLFELPRERFSALLVDKVVRFVQSSQLGLRIDVGDDKPDDDGCELHVPLNCLREGLGQLNPAERYHIVGGELNARALAAFILTQQGFDAWLVE